MTLHGHKTRGRSHPRPRCRCRQGLLQQLSPLPPRPRRQAHQIMRVVQQTPGPACSAVIGESLPPASPARSRKSSSWSNISARSAASWPGRASPSVRCIRWAAKARPAHVTASSKTRMGTCGRFRNTSAPSRREPSPAAGSPPQTADPAATHRPAHRSRHERASLPTPDPSCTLWAARSNSRAANPGGGTSSASRTGDVACERPADERVGVPVPHAMPGLGASHDGLVLLQAAGRDDLLLLRDRAPVLLLDGREIRCGSLLRPGRRMLGHGDVLPSWLDGDQTSRAD